MRKMRLCSVECCERKHWARGYCKVHYSRERLYGDPNLVKRPKLEFKGQTRRIVDWAKDLGITAPALYERLRSGWPVERALTEKRGRFGPRARIYEGGS
jgi:hypothetical protein